MAIDHADVSAALDMIWGRYTEPITVEERDSYFSTILCVRCALCGKSRCRTDRWLRESDLSWPLDQSVVVAAR